MSAEGSEATTLAATTVGSDAPSTDTAASAGTPSPAAGESTAAAAVPAASAPTAATATATADSKAAAGSDSDSDGDDDGPAVDESNLTPAQREALAASRREAKAAKKRAKKAKKKAALDAAKKRKREGQGAPNTAASNGAKTASDAAVAARNVKPKPAPASTALPAAAASFGLAAMLASKGLRTSDSAQTAPAAGTAPAPASAAPASAAAAVAAATAAPASVLSASLSLEEWRAMAASRAELAMHIVGEDVTAARLAAKRAAIEANRLVGIGGGYKEADGWKCQSFNCTGHTNFKNDTTCKKCGAARRY